MKIEGEEVIRILSGDNEPFKYFRSFLQYVEDFTIAVQYRGAVE